MARGLAEDRSRRLGRVEILRTELEQLPDGYQPTDEERATFQALEAEIAAAYKLTQGHRENPDLASAWQEIDDLKDRIVTLEAALDVAKAETEQAKGEADLARADLAQAQAEIEKLKTENRKLKTGK